MVSQDISKDVNFRAFVACLTVSIVMVILRTFARRVQERVIAAQDIFCWFSLATYVSYVGLYLNILDTLYEIAGVASGKMAPPPDFQANGNRIMRYFFAIQLLFWLSIYSVKISLLCLVRRLTQGVPLYEKVWIAVLAFTVLAFVGCVITELTSCQPLKSYFMPGVCITTRDANAQAASLYFALAVDLITDLMIMSIPLRLLWNLQISRAKKISAMAVMGVGIVTMVCAIIRTSSLSGFAKAGPIPVSWIALWAAIEGLAAIVVNCLPAFAIALRARHMPTSRRRSSKPCHTDAASQPKGRETYLLEDAAPIEPTASSSMRS